MKTSIENFLETPSSRRDLFKKGGQLLIPAGLLLASCNKIDPTSRNLAEFKTAVGKFSGIPVTGLTYNQAKPFNSGEWGALTLHMRFQGWPFIKKLEMAIVTDGVYQGSRNERPTMNVALMTDLEGNPLTASITRGIVPLENKPLKDFISTGTAQGNRLVLVAQLPASGSNREDIESRPGWRIYIGRIPEDNMSALSKIDPHRAYEVLISRS